MHWRKITIDNTQYKYYIGKQNAVVYNPNTYKKHIIPLTVITGMTWDAIERAKWKKYFSVTPKQISNYIRNTLCSNHSNISNG